jgi:hypothetical protein
MIEAVVSKKAIPSRPWFANTMPRLPAGSAVAAVIVLPRSYVMDGEKL